MPTSHWPAAMASSSAVSFAKTSRREVVHPAAHDPLGLRLALRLDHRRDQRLVVDLLRRAQAQLALPLRAGERLVGAERRRVHSLRVVGNRACAHRQPVPASLRVAQVRRHVLVEHLRLHRLQQSALRRIPEFASIHRHQDVGRGIASFGREALDQHRRIAGRELHLDAGFARVVVEHGLDQLLVACRVDDQRFGRGRAGSRQQD